MVELVTALTSAGVCGLVWVAWRYPAIFTQHFTVFTVISPWLALAVSGAFILGYDAKGMGAFSVFESLERQGQFLGLIFAIGLLGGLVYGLSQISPHRRKRVAKKKAPAEDQPED